MVSRWVESVRARMDVEQEPVPRPLTTTVGRGYAEALVFFALALGTFAVTAILDGAAQWGFHPGWSTAAYRWEWLGQWETFAVLTLWFAAVRRCRLVWAWAVGIAALIAGYAIWTGGHMRTPDGMYDAVAASTGLLLALVLARQHFVSRAGFGIGRGWGRSDYTGRSRAYRVFEWAFAANVLTTLVGGGMVVVGFASGNNPIHPGEHPAGIALRILSSGVIEEVMVAVVVIALSAAHRPAWEMYALSTLMRVSYHMYYQTTALSFIAMGLINVWLYRRSRRLTPIILAHIAYDAVAWTFQIGPRWGYGTLLAIYAGCLLATKYWTRSPDDDQSKAAPEPIAATNEPTS
jgi:hypothetical protein